MIRKVLTALFKMILRIFFCPIELEGEGKVPETGPVVFVMNHPNALVDPLFVLCLVPRRVSFLAKATLFKMPVISQIIKGFDAVPVHRRQDEGSDLRKNQEMFESAQQLLNRGGTLALFPEGVSHSAPEMKPLKTGAARIAYGAISSGLTEPLKVVPAGLYYTAKGTFRSGALVVFGDPIEVEPLTEVTREDVDRLTEKMSEALSAVTLQAENHEALQLIGRVERIVASIDSDDWPLDERFALRKRLLEGYHRLEEEAPERLEVLVAEVDAYETEVRELGLEIDHLDSAMFTLDRVVRYGLKSVFWLLLMSPLALLGTALYFPAYQVIGKLAMRMSRGEDDMIATIKVLGAMLFFPLTWCLLGALGWPWLGWSSLFVAMMIGPLLGWLSLVFLERFAALWGAAKGLAVFLARRHTYSALCESRAQIREMLRALDALLGAGGEALERGVAEGPSEKSVSG